MFDDEANALRAELETIKPLFENRIQARLEGPPVSGGQPVRPSNIGEASDVHDWQDNQRFQVAEAIFTHADAESLDKMHVLDMLLVTVL